MNSEGWSSTKLLLSALVNFGLALSVLGERVFIFMHLSLTYHSYSIFRGHCPGVLRGLIYLPPLVVLRKKNGIEKESC